MKYLKHSIVIAFALATLGYFAFGKRDSMNVHAKADPGPPLLRTGAPGEGTCVGCHYTFGDTNVGLGNVRIIGLPAVYTPGQTYNLTLKVSDPQARSWGFELTAIDANGRSSTDTNGLSPVIGNLDIQGSPTMLKRTASVGDKTRIYLSHAFAGIQAGQANYGTWSFTWTAPSADAGDIIFYAAGNATDNQVTPEGDYIYTTRAVVKSPTSELLTSLSSYSIASGSVPTTLTVQGTFDAGSKIVFYGNELTAQAVTGGLSATIPSNLLSDVGAFPVAVKLSNGALTNTRFLSLSSAVNPDTATTVDAATYSTNVTPGEIVSLFGTNRFISGTGSAQAPAIPLPITMQNTVVYVNGVPAPLFYTRADQINFQIPFNTATGTASVVVLRGDNEITRGTVNVAAKAPTLFTISQLGSGQAVAENAVDNSLNGDPATGAVPGMKRAKKGEYLVLYGTGTGAQLVDFNTRQPITISSGVSAGASPLAATAVTPTVTIGGKTANVIYSGLHPVYVGLWQLNVQVPTDAPSGAAVEIIIDYGGVTSKPLTVAIE